MDELIDILERTCEEEVLDWYRLTPAQRFEQSQALWPTFLDMGGTLDPEPDSQSPFYFDE